MIVSDEHRFVFIHIPKCAGGSVRSVLRELDSTGGRFSETYEMHRMIGKVDMTHIPLNVLRENYPDVYKKIEDYYFFEFVTIKP